MSDKRFELTKINPTVNLSDTVYFIIDYENPNKEIRTLKDCVGLLNEQQATITEYEDFCYNLCMFIIGKDLDDEFREKYGKEYNIITKWKGCGSDE